ncbi:MAG TPA: nitroreductase family protein [Nitrososphaeraceae archaeon]|jgi:nitroreductase|nr:nitroreductase family protein [Nitrososphaeraceae archaeon]
MQQQNNPTKIRKVENNINPLFVNRWSPRAMSGEEISHDDLMGLFEAARWAPSSYNNQPWRFIYAMRNTDHWQRLFSLLIDWNKIWAQNAAVIVAVISRKNFEFNEKPAITHQFDAGAAWENLALEATTRGLVTHGMQGFDYNEARKALQVPDSFDVMAMIAIGKLGQKENLPSDLQEREYPSDRKSLKEIVMEGKFIERSIE